MRVNDELDHPQNFPAQVESITEATFLSFLCSQSLDWLQIEVVVQMKVVQVFAVNEKV